jgi:hypothetical protein
MLDLRRSTRDLDFTVNPIDDKGRHCNDFELFPTSYLLREPLNSECAEFRVLIADRTGFFVLC